MFGLLRLTRNIVRLSDRINKRYLVKKKRNFDAERPCGPRLIGRRRYRFRRREDNLDVAILAVVAVAMALTALFLIY